MRHSKKSQYTEIRERVIYILISPLTKEFFIGHCRKDLLKSVFRDHYYGERYQTKTCFSELKKQNLHPCLFVLEEITTTKVDAFNYVVAWTKIFHEAGYISLNQGNVMSYIKDLLEKNRALYLERNDSKIFNKLSCEDCLVSNYGRVQCPLYVGGKRNND